MFINSDDNKLQVRQANDIVELIGSYIPQLRRAGSKMVCHCPWHDDRRPSLQIDPARQTWVCWVCDIRGDVFDFVMRREGVDFPEALRILADRAGIELRRSGKRVEKGSPDDKQTLYQAMTWVQQQYQHCLMRDEAARPARDYLAGRGISAESIERFRLGFSPLDGGWLESLSRNTQWSPAILEACGVLVPSDRMPGHYDRFRGRLMFPIHDTLGRTIAFGGRLVPGVFPEGQEPPGKYINSPETRLFSKSENLYGLHLASQSTTRTRQLIVVEGYTDVIGAVQGGMEGVVAALGTAVNQRHIRLMKRYADRIILVLDGDAAGQRRTSEVLDLFVAESVDLRILTLPTGMDPFDFVMQRGAEELNALLASAPDALEHRIRIETAGVDLLRDSHRAVQALDRILETMAHAPRSLTATGGAAGLREEQLLTRLARQFQVDPLRVRQRLHELRGRTQAVPALPPAPAAAPAAPVQWNSLDRTEMTLIELLLTDAELLDTTVEQVAPESFAAGPLQRLYAAICEGYHQSLDVSFEGLMVLVDDPQLRDLLVRLDESARAKQSMAVLSTREQLDDVLGCLRNREGARVQQIIQSQVASRSLDDEAELEAIHQLLNQTRERMGITVSREGTPARQPQLNEPPESDGAEDFPPAGDDG